MTNFKSATVGSFTPLTLANGHKPLPPSLRKPGVSISQHMLHYFWSCPEPNSLPLLSVVPWPSSVLLPMAGFHLDDSQVLTWLPFLLLSLFHSAGPSALPEHPIEMSSPLRSFIMFPYLFPYLYSMVLSLRFIFKLYICVCVCLCGCLHNLEQSTRTPGAGVTGQCGLPNVGVGNCTSQEQCMLSSLQQLFLDLFAYINLQTSTALIPFFGFSITVPSSGTDIRNSKSAQALNKCCWTYHTYCYWWKWNFTPLKLTNRTGYPHFYRVHFGTTVPLALLHLPTLNEEI